jgi:hypothetical protein
MPQKVKNKGKILNSLFPIKIFIIFFSREILEEELESVGIRLNRRKPDIYFKVLM